MRRLSHLPVLAAIIALCPAPAGAQAACDEAAVHARLAEIEHWFVQPLTQEKLAAAQADWAADGNIDSDESAAYLGTVAAYHDIKRNFDGGSIEGACEMLARSDALVRRMLDGL